MSKSSFQFEVEITHQDPPAQYKDRQFRYIVEDKSDFDDSTMVLRFCMNIVRRAVDKLSRSQGQTYVERFEKIKDRTYEYWVIEPNTD